MRVRLFKSVCILLIAFLLLIPGSQAEYFRKITIDSLLPAQGSATNKFLQSNGTNALWTTVDKSFLNLGNVENTALSTWAGTSNITTVGTLSAGTVPVARLSGAVGISNGGHGQTTANAGLNALLPTQTGNTNKFLQTDGSNTLWTAITGTLPTQTGNSGRVLGTNGTSASWVTAPTAGCSGCVVTEAADISNISIDDNSNDDGVALDTWIESHKTNQIVHFTPGVYSFKTMMAVNNASNIEFRCDPGAVFQKDATMDDHDLYEYFMAFNFGTNININGCKFQGLTSDPNTVEAGEQGIACFSCHGFRVFNNYFEDIGDSAVRSTTNAGDPLANNSTDTWIVNNIFDNVAQVTTTDANSGTAKAGTSGYWVLNNRFYNLKWSLKVCTRAAGQTGIHIIGNEIWSNSSSTITSNKFVIGNIADPNDDTFVQQTIAGTADGVELCSVNDAWVEDNNIHDSFVAGITQYTNPSPGLTHFNYANFHIKGNVITNTGIGIRFANDKFSDGIAGDVSGVSIDDNIIKGCTGVGAYSIIVTGAGGVHGSSVTNNKIISPASGQYMTLPGTGVLNANNVLN